MKGRSNRSYLLEISSAYPDRRQYRDVMRRIALVLGVPPSCLLLAAGANSLISLLTLYAAQRTSKQRDVRSLAGVYSFAQYRLAADRHAIPSLFADCGGCRELGEGTIGGDLGGSGDLCWITTEYHLESDRHRDCGSTMSADSAFLAMDLSLAHPEELLLSGLLGSDAKVAIFSFSKYFDIPGARVGLLVAEESVVSALRDLQYPHSISSVALELVPFVLHEKRLAMARKRYEARRQSVSVLKPLSSALAELGVSLSFNAYNAFVFGADRQSAKWLSQSLKREKVRHWRGTDVLDEIAAAPTGCVRISLSPKSIAVLCGWETIVRRRKNQ
jgi:histidinol-phosphate/aromatic aminotransferase/cobyric acid decarboxylase-like protein